MDTTIGNQQSALATIRSIQNVYRYILKRWYILFLVGLLGGGSGILYAWLQKPEYIAELTFAPESDKGGGLAMYAGLAAQFGLDMGGGSGGAFEGENLSEFLKSRLMIDQTLMSEEEIGGKNDLLINHYIRINEMNKGWDKDLKDFQFTKLYAPGVRRVDSVMKVISKDLSKSLNIDRKDKKLNIILATIKSRNEEFAKDFLERLVNSGIDYYVQYRSGKSRHNLQILQRQTDSVKQLLSGGIISVANTTDLNINPLRQIVRTGVQRKQIDLQVNSKVFEELTKQLELTKISVARETPFIQIIDTPIMPLEKKKLGRLMAGIIFSFIAVFITLIFLILKFFTSHYIKTLTLK